MKLIKENMLDKTYKYRTMREIYEREMKILKFYNTVKIHGIFQTFYGKPRNGMHRYVVSKPMFRHYESDLLTLVLPYRFPYYLIDFIIRKFPKLRYFDISENGIFSDSEENMKDLKLLLDHPSMIFVNICNKCLTLSDIESLNESQLRKIIWIDEDKLDTKLLKLGSFSYMEDEIKSWHRQFYAIMKPFSEQEEDESE
jgi:hypothetical protein